MAVIQKIRDKYAKLAGFAVALALVGFILMDAASGRFSELFGHDNSIAKINGKKIDYKEYAERIQEYEALYEALGNNKIDDNTRAQIHDQVLKEMLYEKAVEDQIDDLGLTVTKEEEKDMIMGPNPDPLVMQFPYFRNPETGQFDPNYMMQFEQNKLDLSNPQAQKAMELWQNLKNYIKRQRLFQKYNTLFVASVYTPTFVIDRQRKDQSYIGGIDYVKVPYTTVNDKDVKVTDADLKDYLSKHAAQYTIEEPTRSIDYVAFELSPSATDTAAVTTKINQLREPFATSTDAESFVNKNSDEQYTGRWITKKSFLSAYSDSILNEPVGGVYGPFYENGSYKLVKVLEKATLPDSVKVRHILIRTEDRGQEVAADSVAKRKIDSVAAAIKAGADFKQLAEKYSEDQGSKATDGEYTFTLQQRPEISKEFADFIFEGRPGQSKVVKVSNDNYAGYHYIEILSQEGYEPAAKIAVITKPLFASEETEQAAYAKANEFAGRNTTGKAFDEAVKKDGLNKLQAQNIKVNDFVLPGLGSSREIIRWMYEAKPGDVSPVFSMDGRYVVAKLSNVQDKGLMKIDASNRPMLESLVIAQKKADVIAGKYKNTTSLATVAQSSGQQVQTADSFNAANPYVANLGYEPKVVGYTFYDGFKTNTVSPAIKGQDGVFFTTLKYRVQNPVNAQDPMQQQMQQMQSMQLKNAIAGALQQSILRNAKIKYNAKNLY